MRGGIVPVICGFLIGVGLMTVGVGEVMMEYQSKAVEIGAAEWVVDQKTGNTTFTWKEKP